MRIAIFGAGAIGGYMGAKLSLAGEDVTLIARGPHLAAMEKNGLRLIDGETDVVARPRLVSDTREAGQQDCVVLAVKAHSVSPALDAIVPMLTPDTAVLTAQNGVPWWYFYKLPGPWENRRVEAVDPGGRIWDAIGPERVIGCVVYPATVIDEPGVVRHVDAETRFSIGEPDGSKSERVAALSKALIGAGLRAPVRSRIRSEMWTKLWGNVAFNPLSILTRATLEQMCADPAVRAFARSVMVEVEAVANALGERMAVSVEQRIDGTAAVGAHKPSTLQDLESGRPMELDALIHAVVELARVADVETPNLNALDGMAGLLDRTSGAG